MTIHEIENASFATLKANRNTLIAEAKAFPVDDLAARYIQARTDAKQRDERMAEMGKEISGYLASLGEANDSLSSAMEKIQSLESELKDAIDVKEKALRTVTIRDKEIINLAAELNAANRKIAELTKE